MAGHHHEARDVVLLDALDCLPRQSIQRRVWRVVRDGRDPLQGSSSRGRWGGDRLETLYTAAERLGAIAEIEALLALQPVFPSRLSWLPYELMVECSNIADLSNFDTLATLGVNVEKYRLRDYVRTQEIADAAFFLGFDGLVVPNARFPCSNVVLFTERLAPAQLIVLTTGEIERIDWSVERMIR